MLLERSEISRKRALNLIWNFHKRRTLKQTISVTHSLTELSEYIKKCTDDGCDSLRIYFGQYSNENNRNLPDARYDGHQTIIFVPIKNGLENIPQSFIIDPLNEGELCPPKAGCDNNDNDGSLYTEIRLGQSRETDMD